MDEEAVLGCLVQTGKSFKMKYPLLSVDLSKEGFLKFNALLDWILNK